MRVPFVTAGISLGLLFTAVLQAGMEFPAVEVPALLPVLFLPGSEHPFVMRGRSVQAAFDAGAFSVRWSEARLNVRFLGSAAVPEGLSRSPALVSLLHADSRSPIPAFQSIVYRQLYPGIDAVYGGERLLKSEFRVDPGADPSAIRLAYEGVVGAPHLNQDGSLVLPTAGGQLREAAPDAYQEEDGRRVAVPVKFQIAGDGTVGFELGAYDLSLPLVIDPALVFSTYFGGSGFDAVTSIAVDGAGNVYFAGWTDSSDLPVNGARQRGGAGVDAFVGKLNPGGSLVYATYLGGRGYDRASGIAVDAAGEVCITGWTDSADFPVVAAHQPVRAGGRDVFVSRLSASGGALVYSTYLGGIGQESGNGIAMDQQGNTYVAGETNSANFPVRQAWQPAYRGQGDAFLTKISPAGALLFSTFLGGAGADQALSVAAGETGAIYVAGGTDSTNFPTTGGVQPRSGGGQDAFVAKFGSTGLTMIYGTYLGGAGGAPGTPESAYGIAADRDGNAYVAGVTSSANFPLALPLFLKPPGSASNGFVTKLSPMGDRLIYSTYLGGSSVDVASSIAADSDGSAYIAGYTGSGDFPLSVPLQKTNAGDYDAFIVKLKPAGNAITFGTYFGGLGTDSGAAIALDGRGAIYIAGQTLSYNLPLASAVQPSNYGNYGGYVAKLSLTSSPSAVSASPSSGVGTRGNFSFVLRDPDGWGDISAVYVVINASPNVVNVCYAAYLTGSRAFYLMNDGASAWLGPVVLGSANALENSSCRISGTGSSATGAGTDLTLNLEIAFKSLETETKDILVAAQDQSGVVTSLVRVGSWTVTPASNHPPAVVSVVPFAGVGSSGVLRLLVTDPDGAADIAAAYMLIHTSPAANAGCYAAYLPNSNSIYLFNDAGTGWLGPAMLGSVQGLENGQCRVGGANSSSLASGKDLRIDLDVSFKPTFIGVKSVYLAAQDARAAIASWLQMGYWTVVPPQNHPPAVVLVSPAAGTASTQSFRFEVMDTDGAADVAAVYVVVHSALSVTAGCYLAYLPASNSVFLFNDAGSGWMAPVTLGSAAMLENSQCRIGAARSSATRSGNSAVLQVDLTFKPAFAGTRKVYMAVQDLTGVVAGFQQVGTWTVP